MSSPTEPRPSDTRPVEPRPDHARFADSQATPFGDQDGVRVWRTPDGDGIGLIVIDSPPDLPRDVESRAAFETSFRGAFADPRVKLMELDFVSVDRVPAVRSIVAVLQQNGGAMFIGSLTIPFADFSFVFKVQCEERGLKGVRERTVLDRQVAAGLARQTDAGIEGEFEPYAERYDADFPIHPLTRVRRWLPRIAAHTLLDTAVKRAERFGLPTA